MSDQDILEIFKRFDKNQDNLISYEEFKELMKESITQWPRTHSIIY